MYLPGAFLKGTVMAMTWLHQWHAYAILLENKVRQLAIILTLATCLPVKSLADNPFIRHYHLESGLASSTVFCALQDSRGFMWFGTDAGVSRFDGRTFSNFSIGDGLAGLTITGMFEDSKNRIWMLADNGKLSYFLDGSIYNVLDDSLLEQAAAKAPFYAAAEDNQGNVWFSTESGELIRYGASGSERIQIPGIDLPVHPDFYFTSDGEFWIITESRFYKLENSDLVPLIGPEIKSLHCLAYHFISKGNALYLSDKGLERLINKNYGVIIQNKKLPFTSRDSRVHYSSNNDIWISDGESRVAWFRYDQGNYSPYRFYSTDIKVNTFFNDNEQNTWICTDGQGLHRVGSQYVRTSFYTREKGLSASHATAVMRDIDSATWLGYKTGAIDRIAGNRIDPYKYRRAGKSGVLALESGPAGHVWAFTRDFIVWIRRIRENRYALPVVIEPGIPGGEPIQAAGSGDGFLYFTTSTHLCRFTGPGNLSYYRLDELPAYSQQMLNFGNETELKLFGIGDGLYAVSIDSAYRVAVDYKFRYPVSGVRPTDDSLLVVATRGNGIMIFRDGRPLARTSAYRSFEPGVVNGISGTDGIFMAATNTGLVRFIATGGTMTAVERFTTGDGLISSVVNDLAVEGGHVYLAGDRGMTILPLSKSKQLVDPPPLYVVSVAANGNPARGPYEFRYRGLRLLFRYSAPTFDAPDQLLFQYKVTGHQEEWEESKFNEVELSTLNPGNYIFQLRARKHNSEWSKPQIVKFEVIAPFYGTLWFRLLVANSLIFLLYLFLRDFVARKFKRQLAVYERQQVLEKERNRISKDMHDDLGADLTNIVILSKIARKTIKPQSHEKDAIDKIETAANDVINKMSEIIWALNPSNDSLYNLVTYLHNYGKEYMDLYEIPIKVSLPRGIPKVMVSAAFRRNIFLVVKEMLHNIVKHAEAESTRVDIRVDQGAARLSVDITDDGRGFEVDNRTGSGNGLLNVRKRMKELGGDITIKSEPGAGTSIHLWAPYLRV